MQGSLNCVLVISTVALASFSNHVAMFVLESLPLYQQSQLPTYPKQHSLGCTNLQPVTLSPPDVFFHKVFLGITAHMLAKGARSPWNSTLHADPLAPHGRDCLAFHEIHFFLFGDIVGTHLPTCFAVTEWNVM